MAPQAQDLGLTPMQWLQPGGKASGPQTGRLRRQRAPEGRQQGPAGARGAHSDGRSQLVGFKPYHAVNVPKHVNMQALATHGDDQPKTTAMLRNIPNRYTQPTLLDEIDKLGFANSYDFFYLPMDTHNRTNVGYAFINFVSQDAMERFTGAFSGSNFRDHSSQKVARVSPAHVQGFYPNVQQFLDRAVTHSRNSQYRPIVVLNGVRKDLSDAYQEIFQPDYQPDYQASQTGYGYYGCEEQEAGGDYTGDYAAYDGQQGFDMSEDQQAYDEAPAMEPEAEDLLPSFLRSDKEAPAEDGESRQYVAQGQGKDWSACSQMWPDSAAYWPDDVYAQAQYGWSEQDAAYYAESNFDPAAAAKSDLQQAMSKWIQVDTGLDPGMHATSSTEGGSRTHSRTSSPRSEDELQGPSPKHGSEEDGRGPSPKDPEFVRATGSAALARRTPQTNTRWPDATTHQSSVHAW